MRVIIEDTPEQQVQREDDTFYYFRKDYLYNGGTAEYSLVLMYSKEKIKEDGKKQ